MMKNSEYRVSREELISILKETLDEYRAAVKHKEKDRTEPYVYIYHIIQNFRGFYGIEFEEMCGITSDEGVY